MTGSHDRSSALVFYCIRARPNLLIKNHTFWCLQPLSVNDSLMNTMMATIMWWSWQWFSLYKPIALDYIITVFRMLYKRLRSSSLYNNIRSIKLTAKNATFCGFKSPFSLTSWIQQQEQKNMSYLIMLFGS